MVGIKRPDTAGMIPGAIKLPIQSFTLPSFYPHSVMLRSSSPRSSSEGRRRTSTEFAEVLAQSLNKAENSDKCMYILTGGMKA